MTDICHVCKKPIERDQPRYGASEEPCHYDCRHGCKSTKTFAPIDVIENIERGERALKKLKEALTKR